MQYSRSRDRWLDHLCESSQHKPKRKEIQVDSPKPIGALLAREEDRPTKGDPKLGIPIPIVDDAFTIYHDWDQAAEDAIFTFDVGTPTVWAARYLTMDGHRRLVGSLVHGSMANVMPQAIGAQAAQPCRQVISLSGDGGFTMLMGDLITLAQMKLPIKVVIFNNAALDFVSLEMKVEGLLNTNIDLKNPDFAAMARAMGIFAYRVEDPGELPGVMKDILDHDGPALLDVVTAKQELSMPPTITSEEVKGFSLWILRAVTSGRGDEV